MASHEDEIAAAYRFFDLTDRSIVPSLDVLLTHVAIINGDSTASADRKEKANKYFELLKDLDNNSAPTKVPANYEMPVGLVNTRNYCYLHSLLQFFYSIRTFRETVVNFQDFAQAIEETDEIELGKLAGTAVTKLHVEDGHQLVPHLTALFERLETAPGPSIRAPEDVAAEALRQPPSAPQRSVSPSDAAQGDTNTVTVKADNPPVGEGNSPDSEMSDVTLIGDTVMTPESEADDMKKDSDADSLKVEGGPGSDDGVSVGDKPEPPSRDPPKVPPRPAHPNDDLVEQYRQQDAHEVSSKIIQRTIAAIKPVSIGTDGERHDDIRDLFYATTQPIDASNNKAKKVFEPDFATNFFIHLHNKPKDVQEGLDIALGEDNAEGSETKYQVIKQAPKILQVYIHHNIFAKKGESVFERKRVDHHMTFNEEIYLDRYMQANQSAIIEKRMEAFDLRKKIAELQAERRSLVVEDVKVRDENANETKEEEIDSADALDALAGFMKADVEDQLVDTNGTEELSKKLRQLSEADAQRVKEIEEEIPDKRAKLDALPLDAVDSNDLKYRIFAAFM
jgi:ubiquitin carboxyl-terminal hydrolase 25/28